MFPPNSKAPGAANAQAIAARRVALGLSVADLASAAGVGQMTIYRLEAGQTRTRMATIRALARALNCEVSQIVSGTAA